MQQERTEIPLDVLEVIFRHLTPHELARCCRINRAVHTLAVEALYRDLRPNQHNVMGLCIKLSNDRNLAHRVRSFVLGNSNVDMYLGVISEALLHLPRLQTLGLFIGQAGSWILPQKDACPFQLKTLACAFFLDTNIVSFLELQHDLQHLTVSGSPQLLRSISPQLIPNLVSIYAPMSVVEVLAPGRPIRDITTFNHIGRRKPSISSLSRTTVPVQLLKVNFGYLQTLESGDLSESTPNLVNLSIDADNVKPDDEDVRELSIFPIGFHLFYFGQMIDELTEWIEEYLSHAKNLKYLNIRFYPEKSTVPCQELDFSDMITSIFAASTRLSHIIITFYGYKAKYVCKRLHGYDWYIVND